MRRRSTGQGSWRTLEPVWQFAPQWRTSPRSGTSSTIPRLLFNTVLIAVIGTIGTVLSCTLVAYGFARFRFPGRGLLFTLLIATIFLPAAVTMIPTYTVFQRTRLGRDVAAAPGPGVLRQRLRRVPHAPVLADDPDRAGRGRGDRRRRPVPDLTSVVIPQAWPVIVAVADVPPRVFVERLLRPADLPVGRAGDPDRCGRRCTVQRHLLPRTRVHPGRHTHDPGHPGRARSSCSSGSSPAASSSPGSRSDAPRRADVRRRASRPASSSRMARNGCSTTLAATGTHGVVLRAGPLGRGVSRASPARSPTAGISSATTRTITPACRC